jgi:hypothetical protein
MATVQSFEVNSDKNNGVGTRATENFEQKWIIVQVRVALQLTDSQSVSQSVRLGVEHLWDS